MIVVRDAKVETMGIMAELPPDLSPFQLGTIGEWNGAGFEIIGRVRVEWEQGSWNEWCILYDATKTGWLAEAQGLLMISFLTEPVENLSTDPSSYAAGSTLKLAGKPWVVDDVKQVTCRSCEGELPHASPPNSLRMGVDLTSGYSSFASIELSGGSAELYVGEYVAFETLKLNNLRLVPGWNGEVAGLSNRTTALACPGCGAAVVLRAAGQTMSAACGNCGALLDTATPELTVIQKASSATHSLQPLIPIGQRGKLSGIEYEVIGLMERHDIDSRWSEYLLFNPWQGFQWLIYYGGHWTLVTRLPAFPDRTSSNHVSYMERDFRLYAKSRAKVTGVLGEFYWKTRREETADCVDYISPPYILSREEYPDLQEFSWSLGNYIQPAIIEKAFEVKNLRNPDGIYLNQPNPHAVAWRDLKIPALVALAVLIFVQIFFTMNRRGIRVANFSFAYDRSQQSLTAPFSVPATSGTAPTPAVRSLVTSHFKIAGHDSRVDVEASAGVDNSWLDLDMELVNVQTNESIPAQLEVSYYHGYDDGNWSEGGQTAHVSFAGVPPGEYILSVEPDADSAISSLPFDVTVRSGGVFFSNFWLCIAVILIYPAVVLWRSYSFERERWSDSTFSPQTGYE